VRSDAEVKPLNTIDNVHFWEYWKHGAMFIFFLFDLVRINVLISPAVQFVRVPSVLRTKSANCVLTEDSERQERKSRRCIS
jgi:hypothetical protein